MSSLSSTASLVVALADLKEVRSVLSAIHAADAASGKTFPVAFIGPAPDKNPGGAIRGDSYEPSRRHLRADTIYNNQRRFHRTPTYAARPVLHPEPRVAPSPSCVVAPPEGERTHRRWPDPPWKVLPPVKPMEPRGPVKVVVRSIDKTLVARTLDLFI